MRVFTYLAQVRQKFLNTQSPHCWKDRQKHSLAFITHPFLPIELRGNCGHYVRAIVTIGTVHVADWDAQNRNMDAWWKDAKC